MKPAMREIVRATAEWFQISADDIRGASRARKSSWPRQIAMTLCRELSGRSLGDIGEFFGGKDHTTIIHARREVSESAKTDDETVRAMMAIAAEASGMSIDRQRLEREWADSLHRGTSQVTVAEAATWQPAPLRRILVPNRSPVYARRLPVTLPSDLKQPTLAQKMGARA